jgi:type II secretory ATPase GspE/PulE/Tfp pilus assembly ATPase PilB-like protein
MNQTTQYLQSISEQGTIEIATLVKHLLNDAIAAGASDIHIEPWESTLVVRIRLNGVMIELVHLPLDLMERISGRLKVMANNRSFDLKSLGFEDETLHSMIRLLTRPSGLLLLTGPTGSGKTTAIYAALHHIVQRSGVSMSISTVEDPVEFNLPMISQAQINPLKDFTYPVALRSLMRQDPQVIMVGEIRDAETAGIAVQHGDRTVPAFVQRHWGVGLAVDPHQLRALRGAVRARSRLPAAGPA